MKKLIEFLWDGCWHVWDRPKIFEVLGQQSKEIVAYKYIRTCTKCGKVKHSSVKA